MEGTEDQEAPLHGRVRHFGNDICTLRLFVALVFAELGLPSGG